MAGVAALLLVACAGWAWHWRTHPSVFPGAGTGVTGSEGRTLVAFGVTYPDTGEGTQVTLHAAEARVVENTADATLAFFVCTVEPERTGALGVGGGDILADVCADRTPLEDGTVLDTGSVVSQQLVLVVTTSRPGVVRTDGVDLTYSHGLQRGTQTIGMDVRVTAG